MWRAMRRYPAALAGVAALLGAAIGLAVAVFALGGDEAPGEDSAEAGFARDMRIHHAQAVDMSMTVYRNGSDPEVRTLAYDIALTQQAQMGIMLAWLTDWDLNLTSTEPAMAWMGEEVAVDDGLMPGMATQDEMLELKDRTGTEADVLYLELMIDHHVGGIHMAQGVLDRSDDETVGDLAETMVNGQQNEITVMNDLMAELTNGDS